MEQDSEWTSVPTADPGVGRGSPLKDKLRTSNGLEIRVAHVPDDRGGWGHLLSRLACSLLLLAAGALSVGPLIWLRFMRLVREKDAQIQLLRKQLDGLMSAPLLGSGSSAADFAYMQELYCRRTQHLAAAPRGAADAAGRAGACERACDARGRRSVGVLQDLQRRWAYITMAHSMPGQAVQHLWGVVALASALQRVGSKYPLLLLTNTTAFADGTAVAGALRGYNVIVQPLFQVDMSQKLRTGLMYDRWVVSYWKLQIWKLTQWERLIWLDADSIVFRNLDWLFERQWMWAQRDDWWCRLNATEVCSGIMLMFPNASDYWGLVEYAERMGSIPHGDQQLISRYFARKRGRPVHLLSDLEAAFGQCLGKAPAPYINQDGTQVQGVWNVPSFVHKSGGWGDTNGNPYSNVCFMPNISMQLYSVGGATLNVCQYNPLGAYWREVFCDAVAHMGIQLLEVSAYCNDECWYRGGPRSAWRGGAGLSARAWRLCGQVNATLSYADYNARRVGFPASTPRSSSKRLLLSK